MMVKEARQALNPISIRGVRNDADSTERCLAMGRLWLTNSDARDGQHYFDGFGFSHRRMLKTMQFAIYEGNDIILAAILADEMDFLPGIKAILAGRSTRFSIKGTPRRFSKEVRMLFFDKVSDNTLRATIHNAQGEVISGVQFEYEVFCNGLPYLFNNGEL